MWMMMQGNMFRTSETNLILNSFSTAESWQRFIARMSWTTLYEPRLSMANFWQFYHGSSPLNGFYSKLKWVQCLNMCHARSCWKGRHSLSDRINSCRRILVFNEVAKCKEHSIGSLAVCVCYHYKVIFNNNNCVIDDGNDNTISYDFQTFFFRNFNFDNEFHGIDSLRPRDEAELQLLHAFIRKLTQKKMQDNYTVQQCSAAKAAAPSPALSLFLSASLIAERTQKIFFLCSGLRTKLIL